MPRRGLRRLSHDDDQQYDGPAFPPVNELMREEIEMQAAQPVARLQF